jgi:hypothetical protein
MKPKRRILSAKKKNIMTTKLIKETEGTDHFNQEIGKNTLKQIIIPSSLEKDFKFTINPKTGDLTIQKKEKDSSNKD